MSNTRDFAFVVGIATYPALPPLNGPVNDAEDFAKWLTKPAKDGGGGIPPEQVTVIVSAAPPPANVDDARPIMDEVLKGLRTLRKAIQATAEGRARRIYLFFAGHGISPNPEETALLMANAEYETPGLHIPGYRYAEYFRLNALAEEVVLIMDCCRDLTQGITPNSVQWANLIMDGGGSATRIFYAYATRWSSKSREAVFDGRCNGLFTYALLEGLANRGGADTRITGARLRDYVRNRLPVLCPPDRYQIPDINIGTATDDIVFLEGVAIPKTAVAVRAADGQPRSVVVRDGSFNETARHELAAGETWTLELLPGLYEFATDKSEQLTQRVLGGNVDVIF